MEQHPLRQTEQESQYHHLESMPIADLLQNINREDLTVPVAVQKAIPQIEKLVQAVTDQLLSGGRLFYIGAGTSGRLGILDASECPPTFGMPAGLVVGILAGGHQALTTAVEFAEDNPMQGWSDLQQHGICSNDIVIGITASGTTPYVLGALHQCKIHGIPTGAITCNTKTPLCKETDFIVEVLTGPEFITGSTRMKSGSAQKLVLNMISTAAMIRLGRIEDNRMVHMQLTNEKLIDRGVRILMERGKLQDYEKVKSVLLKEGSVPKAWSVLEKLNSGN